MTQLAGRIGVVVTGLSLALASTAWAGAAQATLAVGVMVPARCAVSVAGTLAAGQAPAASDEAVAMKCTKGTLPPSSGPSVRTGAVGPRITRDVVLTSAQLTAPAPRPAIEQGPFATPDVAFPSLVITVNF